MTDIGKVLEERGSRYGEFKNHAQIAQGLKHEMHASPGWAHLDPDMKEALEMVQHKIARILNGDPQYLDSWLDGAGYFKLVADSLEAKAEPQVAPSNDGWIEWRGGECPVEKYVLVDVRLKEGDEYLRHSAGGWAWFSSHTNPIIAYRLSHQASKS